MILVFGGTKEAKVVTCILETKGYRYFYSTDTEIDFETGDYGIYRCGAFNVETLIDFCQEGKINLIIYAPHSYTDVFNQTLYQVSLKQALPVICFEQLHAVAASDKLPASFMRVHTEEELMLAIFKTEIILLWKKTREQMSINEVKKM